MLSFLAQQFTDAEDPTGLLRQLTPLLGLVIPFITARVTKAESRKWLKFGVAVGLSGVVTVATGLGLDWTEWQTGGVLLERFATLVGVFQVTYVAADAYAKRTVGEDGLNGAEMMKPTQGIG